MIKHYKQVTDTVGRVVSAYHFGPPSPVRALRQGILGFLPNATEPYSAFTLAATSETRAAEGESVDRDICSTTTTAKFEHLTTFHLSII